MWKFVFCYLLVSCFPYMMYDTSIFINKLFEFVEKLTSCNFVFVKMNYNIIQLIVHWNFSSCDIAGRISLNGCAFALRDPKSGSRGRLVEADSCSKTLALIAAVFDLLRYWNSVWLHCTALFSQLLLSFYISSLCRPQPRLRRRSLPPNPSIYILHSFKNNMYECSF